MHYGYTNSHTVPRGQQQSRYARTAHPHHRGVTLRPISLGSLEILRQQRIVELTADYRRKGLEDAEQLARQMVEAELNAEIAREKNR